MATNEVDENQEQPVRGGEVKIDTAKPIGWRDLSEFAGIHMNRSFIF
jgi:hypothetical protein